MTDDQKADFESIMAYLRTIRRPTNAEIDRAGEILRFPPSPWPEPIPMPPQVP